MVKFQRDAVSETFYALADPTRRAILEQLAENDSSVTALAQPFLGTMSLPAVSKHLRVLEKAGLLTQTRDGRVRRCHLESAPLQAAAGWIDQYRRFWESQLDSLATFLETLDEDSAESPPADNTP